MLTDTNVVVHDLPVNRLFIDEEFNSRGHIKPSEVKTMIESIQSRGLQYPIIVQPFHEKEGYDYRVISGNRRCTAFRQMGRETIPAIIKEGLSELTARLMNLEENIQRENLNIVQEAKAIEKIRYSGLPQSDIAKELKVSTGWVNLRCIVLDLPEEIQREIENGVLSQNQIRAIYTLPRTKQFEEVKKIKSRKLRGEKNIKVTQKVSTESKRARDKHGINAMLDHIYDHLGPSFATRALSWAAGNIPSSEIFKEIKKIKEAEGKYYQIPEDELE